MEWSRFTDEKVTNRPTLQQLFNIFVEEGEGEIYALIDNDEILGYLSCAPAYLNIWDVDFIYIKPHLRNKGLGTQIVRVYALDKLTQGKIPYYSNARDSVSARVAQKAGFICCREVYYVEAYVKE
nr:GNAT family N-acetyltransferase [Caldanaerobius fijiensis]